MFKYNKTEPFFFNFMSPILNIGLSQNFPTQQPAKINLAQAGKYFVYERKEILSFSRLSGKTIEKLFSYEQPLSCDKKRKLITYKTLMCLRCIESECS